VLALPAGTGHLEISKGTRAVAALREKGAIKDVFHLHSKCFLKTAESLLYLNPSLKP
jgi:hypothetical protein